VVDSEEAHPPGKIAHDFRYGGCLVPYFDEKSVLAKRTDRAGIAILNKVGSEATGGNNGPV
jgi:hypothetical protein